MISRSTGKMWLRLAGLAILPVLLQAPGRAQRSIAGSVRTRLALERLNNLGSVLMIGAHPDDENTGLLAYLARGRKVRAAYLSATRGEGGQNLIGSEQAEMLGLIRTQELLAARRIDGAEQFFTRAIDFGYSKTAEETLAKWDRDRALSDIVWLIRRFRPDVVVLQERDARGWPRASPGSRHPGQGSLCRRRVPIHVSGTISLGGAVAGQAFAGTRRRVREFRLIPASSIRCSDSPMAKSQG